VPFPRASGNPNEGPPRLGPYDDELPGLPNVGAGFPRLGAESGTGDAAPPEPPDAPARNVLLFAHPKSSTMLPMTAMNATLMAAPSDCKEPASAVAP